VRLERIDVSFAREAKGTWTFARRAIRGTEFEYEVVDRNFPSRNTWTFVVRAPAGDGYTEVRPLRVPNRKVWAPLGRRSWNLARCETSSSRGHLYGKLMVATGDDASRRQADPRSLPRWFDQIRVLTKSSVVRDAAKDAGAPVVTVQSADHGRMIRLYLALKAWPLYASYLPGDPKWRRRRTERDRSRKRARLRGLVVTPTGKLAYGTRQEVLRWLRLLGCLPRTYVSSRTDVVLEGSHYLGAERQKMMAADYHDVARLSEAAFRRRYGL